MTFPSGSTETSYSHCYINRATKECYISIYVTFPNGLVSGGATIISEAPIPINGSMNVLCLDYSSSGIEPFPAYFDYGALRSRKALTAGHTILGSFIYLMN